MSALSAETAADSPSGELVGAAVEEVLADSVSSANTLQESADTINATK